MKRASFLASIVPLILLTLLTGLPAAAQTGTWTAVASTGTVDESAAGVYAFSKTILEYAPGGSLAPIIATYNVTNTFGGGFLDTPPWTTFEMGYMDFGQAGTIRAQLFEVEPCTGQQTLLCQVASAGSANPTCSTCALPSTLNFAASLYYVQVIMSRTDPTISPQLFTLRIY